MTLANPYKIGNQMATINNKLVASEFHIPGTWGLSVVWNNQTIYGLGVKPMGLPTANTNSANYNVQMTWGSLMDRIEWNSTGSAFYTGISAAGLTPRTYYNLYWYGPYYEWPNGYFVDYSASDSAGNYHSLPTSLDLQWSGGGGAGNRGLYIQLGEQGRPDAYIIQPLTDVEEYRLPGSLTEFSAHFDIVYPTGW